MTHSDDQTLSRGEETQLATERGGSANPSPARRRPDEGLAAPPAAATGDGSDAVSAPDGGEQASTAPEASAETLEGSSPEPESGSAEEATVESDLDELKKLCAQRDEYLALAQRTQADFENYRKRTAKDARLAETRGVVKLAKELLPALDNLGRALESAAQDDPLLDGVRLVHKDLVGALARLGIESYSPNGERFDPNEHEAMAQQPVEGAEAGTVVEVYQAGYRLNGAIIRPARVVVAA